MAVGGGAPGKMTRGSAEVIEGGADAGDGDGEGEGEGGRGTDGRGTDKRSERDGSSGWASINSSSSETCVV
jgi:hypothetical protein